MTAGSAAGDGRPLVRVGEWTSWWAFEGSRAGALCGARGGWDAWAGALMLMECRYILEPEVGRPRVVEVI